mmetsp:Transcript_35806/g.72669  ORF Transcript_35806/g.72669 Transcript_35806/m.72669 type:complete len:1684 (+) Transcript_35806:365-5416(+)
MAAALSGSAMSMSGSWQSVTAANQTPAALQSPSSARAAAQTTSTFRIVTYAGTHIYCSAPSPADRDVWLAALHAGLESCMMSVSEVLTEVQVNSTSAVCFTTSSTTEEGEGDGDGGAGGGRSDIGSGGRRNAPSIPTTTELVREPSLSVSEQTILTPPISQKRGIGSSFRRKLLAAQHQSGASAAAAAVVSQAGPISSFGYAAPYESLSPPAPKHCISCGRYPPQTAYRPQSCPLAQYGMETRVDTCAECLISQGLLGHVKMMTGMYSSDALERSALVRGRELVRECIDEAVRVEEEELLARRKKMEQELREKSEKELLALVKEAGAKEIYADSHATSTKDDPGTADAGGADAVSVEAGTDDEDVAAVRKAIAEAEMELSGDSGGTANEAEGDSNSSGEGTAGSSSWTAVNSHTTAESDLIVDGAEDSTDSSGKAKAASVGSPLSGSWADVPTTAALPLQGHTGRQAWVSLPPLPATTVALLELIGSPNFQTLRRRSRVLDQNCKRLENGVYGGNDAASEFLEILEEHAREASVRGMGNIGGVNAEAIELKKQALALSANLGSTVRLLKESALGQKGPPSTETLASILEYLLDVVEDGDLASVGFFWPQLRQIHLNMLPALDVGSLVRVELVEDFLLTVAVQHSVHLALELVWGCIADLEESLGSPNTASYDCRRRRFAVLRFVCELESLLFDFDGGWGGGSVSLRSMLSPSQHQAILIKDAFCVLQLHRMYGSHHLSRSARLNKLKKEADREEKEIKELEADRDRVLDTVWSDSASNSSSSSSSHADTGAEIVASAPPPAASLDAPDALVASRARTMTTESTMEDAAAESVRMARNADYFSTQLMFTRRLGDIAERLRFTDVEKRSAALQAELDVLNSSGKMGGDPLNRICDAEGNAGGLAHVVHVPRNEGHVFRSKERTPVLLLMELIREESDIAVAAIRKSKIAKTKGSEEKFDDGIVGEMKVDKDDVGSVDDKDSNIDIFGAGLDDGADVPPSPMTSSKAKVLSNSLLDSPRRKLTEESASGVAGVTDPLCTPQKEEMEGLVASMMESQLNLPELGDHLDLDRTKQEVGEVTETPPKKEREEVDKEKINKEPVVAKTEATSPERVDIGSSSMSTSASPRLSPLSRGPVRRNRSSSNLSSRKGGLIGDSCDDSLNLSAHGEGRREVLTTIFLKGMKSSNAVARSAAPAAQRAVQAMDRQRAFQLMNQDTTEEVDEASEEDTAALSGAIVITSNDGEEVSGEIATAAVTSLGDERNKADDEAMEALRLLIIQNRVAQGNLSAEMAASFLASSEASIMSPRAGGSTPETEGGEAVDAGDIDPRLAGCGILPHTVLSALKLWKTGTITSTELLNLVQKDNQFLEHSALPGAENESKLMEDSNFWGRFAFGERWAEKKARIQTSSEHGSTPGWDLAGVIVKSNDDLRQESFVMQLIELSQEAFESAGLELWVHPYRILATGRTTGIIEMVRNAMSFDSLKKRPGYGTAGLRGHLQRMTEFAANPIEAFETAQKNFVRSLASYSLMSYLFLFKDRHNGNLLLDTGGHVIHIDFGFVFGIAPGGSFSLEQSTPFKLTEEMLEVMGGTRSPLFSEFVTLFCCGFLALQAHAETFITLVEVTCDGSSFHCFEGKQPDKVVAELRERFCIGLDREATVVRALDLIKDATSSYGTKQYDYFQYLSQGIAS